MERWRARAIRFGILRRGMSIETGRSVPVMPPKDRPASGRFLEGPWSVDSLSDADLAQAREYARHARSMSARRRRQRAFVLALLGCVVAAATVIAAPTAVRLLADHPSLRPVILARRAAIAWITRWVSSSAFISCDPLMCSDLHAHGIPGGRLVRIGVDAPDPVGSDVVVATQAIRSLFRSRLASVYAPVVLASFGTGNAKIDVRVVPATGSADRYLRALRRDQLARKAAGEALLHNANLTESPAAAKQLAAGQVDSRILITLPELAARIGSLRILAFGGAAPGASPAMPLLSIALAIGGPAGRGAVTAARSGVQRRALAKIIALLNTQIQPLRPARCRKLTSPSGRAYLRIDYAAPTDVMVFNGSA